MHAVPAPSEQLIHSTNPVIMLTGDFSRYCCPNQLPLDFRMAWSWYDRACSLRSS